MSFKKQKEHINLNEFNIYRELKYIRSHIYECFYSLEIFPCLRNSLEVRKTRPSPGSVHKLTSLKFLSL